jgi:hypothetical protein
MKAVNITRLKSFVIQRLSPLSPLREVLLQEKDEIPPSDFLARLSVWLALLRHEEERLK